MEQLIPGMHKTNKGEEIEPIHAFAIKLRADISKDILARDFNYPTLTALIEAAKRYETRADSNSTAFDVKPWSNELNISLSSTQHAFFGKCSVRLTTY